MVGRTTLNLFISAPIFSSDNIQSSQNTVLIQRKCVRKTKQNWGLCECFKVDWGVLVRPWDAGEGVGWFESWGEFNDPPRLILLVRTAERVQSIYLLFVRVDDIRDTMQATWIKAHRTHTHDWLKVIGRGHMEKTNRWCDYGQEIQSQGVRAS